MLLRDVISTGMGGRGWCSGNCCCSCGNVKDCEAGHTAAALRGFLSEVPLCDVISSTMALIARTLSACVVVLVKQSAGFPPLQSGHSVFCLFVLPGRSGCVCAAFLFAVRGILYGDMDFEAHKGEPLYLLKGGRPLMMIVLV